MPVEFADLLTAAPEVSANFMLLEIRLGYTFAHMARSQTKRGAYRHGAEFKEKAILVAKTVRKRQYLVTDSQQASRVTEALRKLDGLISTLPPVESGRNPAAQIRT